MTITTTLFFYIPAQCPYKFLNVSYVYDYVWNLVRDYMILAHEFCILSATRNHIQKLCARLIPLSTT